MRDHASRVIAAQRSQRSLAAGPAQYLIAAVVTIEEDIVACHGKAECRCAGQEQQQQRVRCNGSQNGCGATAQRVVKPDMGHGFRSRSEKNWLFFFKKIGWGSHCKCKW